MSWRPELAGLHLGAGERLVDPRFQVLRVERDADQERDGPVGLIPECEAGGAEGLAEDVQEPAVELIAEDLDIGDVRVGDHHPGERPPGLDDPGFSHDHGDLGLGLPDHLDQVGDILGHLAVGAARRRAGRTAGNESGRVAPELNHPRLEPAPECLARAGLGLDGNDPGDRSAGREAGGRRNGIRDSAAGARSPWAGPRLQATTGELHHLIGERPGPARWPRLRGG